VLRDYEQIADRDYDETYTEVIRSEISRLLLFLAAKYEETGMQNCRPASISMDSKLQLQGVTEDSEIIDQKIYARRVGQLLHLAVQSRPDITQAIARLTQFNTKPDKAC
jgi:hypothetical protein